MMPIQPLHLLLASFCVIADITVAFAPPVRSGSSSARQGKVPFLSFITRRILQVDKKWYEDSRNGGAGRSLNVVSIDPKKSSSSSKSADSVPPRTIGDAAATIKNVSSDLNTKNMVNDSDVGKEIFLSHLHENMAVAKLLSASSADSTSSLNDEVLNPTIANGGATNAVSEEIASDTVHIADSSRAVNEIAKASLPGNVAAATVAVVESPATVEKATTKATRPRAATSTTTTSAPNVAKILKFAIPATGVWLCGPLLSLIDTSTVGILSGTVQQAALNPAVAVTDYAALLIAFLYTGTTNLIASARDSHGSDGDRVKDGQQKMIQRLIGALQLSTFVGAGLGTILFCFAKPLLTTIIGNDGISPAVFDAAMKYVKIRAIGMPAAAVIGSAQAACLGLQDIKSPLYVLAVAAAVNFVGDMLFVGSSHPLIGGAAGAAWATVFSQYAAVGLFIHWLCHKPQNQQERPKMVDLAKASPKSNKIKKPTTSKPKEPSFSVRGFLQGRFRARDLLKPPSRQLVQEFSPYVLPVTSTQVGRVSGYVAMAHVVSSSLGTVSMAAQQVIVSLFYCLCPMADALSLTAQSFVPAIYEKPPSKQRTQALRKTIVNFVKAGAIFGSTMVAAVAGIPLMSRFFTTDQVVISMVNQVVPLLISFFSVHGILCAAEGLLVGQKDLGFLGKMYAGYFFAMPFFIMRVKKAALSGTYSDIGLTSVWRVFVGYQAFRFSAWMIRVGFLQRRNERKTPTTQTMKSVPVVTNGGGLATAASGAM